MTEALFALAGVALGYWMAVNRFDRLFRLAAQYRQTGVVQLVTPEPAKPDGPVTASPEAAAAQRVTDDAIKRGTEHVMAMYAEQGVKITRAQAEAEARQLFESAQPLGGVR